MGDVASQSRLKRRATGLVALLSLLTISCQRSPQRAPDGHEIIDALGAHVSVVKHPRRIITLVPSLGELAADIEAGHLERIVGVSDFTDYPKALSKVKSVGSYSRIHIEEIASLRPDLILATEDGNARDQVNHLRELHFPVVVVKTESLSDIEQSIRILGEAMGERDRAKLLDERFKAGLAGFRERTQKRKKDGVPSPRVLLQLDSNPLIVVGGGTFINEAIELLGAKNIYGNTRTHYPRPSLEDAVRKNPDIILLFGEGKSLASARRNARDWKRFPELKAVKKGDVKILPPDQILRPSLRILKGLALLEHAIYGK